MIFKFVSVQVAEALVHMVDKVVCDQVRWGPILNAFIAKCILER
jgi:hypothetical protein